ncbi:unnamed protein product [Caenorhabditis brenneri]
MGSMVSGHACALDVVTAMEVTSARLERCSGAYPVSGEESFGGVSSAVVSCDSCSSWYGCRCLSMGLMLLVRKWRREDDESSRSSHLTPWRQTGRSCDESGRSSYITPSRQKGRVARERSSRSPSV